MNFFFLLLGATVAHGQIATNSTNKNTSSTARNGSSVAAFKCLQLDDDDHIQESLTSSKNYYNISGALYPSVDIPSLYVKITVQFNSSTTNGSFTIGKLKRYTWSKSCLYVATQFVSLCALNVYSLGAIWPNKRREAKLSITLPEFCNATEEKINTKMISVLSRLEDLAVIPKVQDPRLNTVECVVEGHDSFDIKIFFGFRKLLMCACWCILIVSAVVGFAMSNIVTTWLGEQDKKREVRRQKTQKTSRSAASETLINTYPNNESEEPEVPAATCTASPTDHETGTELLYIGQKTVNGGSDNTNPPTLMERQLERIIRLQEQKAADKAGIKEKETEEKNEHLKCKTASFEFLICLLAVIEQALVVTAVLLACCACCGAVVYPAAYLAFLHVILLPVFYFAVEKGKLVQFSHFKKFLSFFILPVAVFVFKCLNDDEEKEEKVRMRNTMIHFTFQMTVHHLLWILLGVMTEPLWAIPVLVVTCGVWYCIHLLAHFFVKANVTGQEKCMAMLFSVVLVLSVMLGLLVLGVVAQSLVGTDPLTGIVSSALVVVTSWWLRRVV